MKEIDILKVRIILSKRYLLVVAGYDYLLKRQVDDGRGIFPDVKVYTSYEEYLVGIDAVYEQVTSGE